MKTFSNLAQFKALLQIGTKLHAIYHNYPAGRSECGKFTIFQDVDKGAREITIKQSNSFALKSWSESDQKEFNSWCQYPKASQCEVKDNTLIIYKPDYKKYIFGQPDMDIPRKKVITYSFID